MRELVGAGARVAARMNSLKARGLSPGDLAEGVGVVEIVKRQAEGLGLSEAVIDLTIDEDVVLDLRARLDGVKILMAGNQAYWGFRLYLEDAFGRFSLFQGIL